jgi:putative Holliday junction resolvase
MRILGLDVGDKTIGVAVSDPLGVIAQGVGIILRTKRESDLIKIKELIKKYAVELIVVGLPWNMNGTLGKQGQKALAFADQLKKNAGVPVQTWDERLTTLTAEKVLLSADLSRARRKKVIDKIAAVLILQNFLDAKNCQKH